MSQYDHILFASDLTPESDRLLLKARDFANHYAARLSVVHVLEQNAFVSGATEFAVPPDSGFEGTLTEQAGRALEKQAISVEIAKEHQWLLVGSIKQEILDLINKQKVDCLAMGAHEHHGLAILFGTTTDKIMHARPCDILALRADS